MDVLPTIRTPRARDFYLVYLTTREWKTRRNRALKLAGWRCSKCQSRRDLQVHHLTYERLGSEPDSDLVVLCVGCHERAHPEHAEHDYLRLYLKLAADVMRSMGRVESVGDLAEDLKCRCARLHIPYDSEKIWRALSVLMQKHPEWLHRHPIVAKGIEHYEWVMPIAKFDARRILEKLQAAAVQHGFQCGPKQMPDARVYSERTIARTRAAQMLSQEILESIHRCEELERNIR